MNQVYMTISEKKMTKFSLIITAVRQGRVYFKPSTNHMLIELYNDELGKTIFKVSIKRAQFPKLTSSIIAFISELLLVWQ